MADFGEERFSNQTIHTDRQRAMALADKLEALKLDVTVGDRKVAVTLKCETAKTLKGASRLFRASLGRGQFGGFTVDICKWNHGPYVVTLNAENSKFGDDKGVDAFEVLTGLNLLDYGDAYKGKGTDIS